MKSADVWVRLSHVILCKRMASVCSTFTFPSHAFHQLRHLVWRNFLLHLAPPDSVHLTYNSATKLHHPPTSRPPSEQHRVTDPSNHALVTNMRSSKRRKTSSPSKRLLRTPEGSKHASDGEASFHRFLDLPAELRNAIYSYVVHVDGPVQFSTVKAPLITAASKPLRAEAFPVFFAEHSFTVDVVTNVDDHVPIANYNPSGPQHPVYPTTTSLRYYFNQYDMARKSGRLRGRKWLCRLSSPLTTFRNIKFTIIPVHVLNMREAHPRYNAGVFVHATRDGVKSAIHGSRWVNEDLLTRAQVSLAHISEQPDFRGFSIEDLQMLASTFERLPPHYRVKEEAELRQSAIAIMTTTV